GTLAELRHLTRTTVEAVTERPVGDLNALAGVHNVVSENGRIRFDVDTDALDSAIATVSRAGIRALTSHPPTLEELMLRHYGDELAAASNGAGK
ncbi:ABC transporter ATP-binding protein, partial [Nocardia sp. NPDC003345]